MRSVALVLALLVASCGAPPAVLAPPTGTASGVGPTSPVPSPRASSSASPSSSPAPTTLHARPVSIPTSFRFIESWTGRILLLDLGASTATDAVRYEAPSSEPGYPSTSLSASRDGETLLVLVRVSPLDATLFVVAPKRGMSRVLMRGALNNAVVSADGSHFAVSRREDAASTGLWLGAVRDGAPRRLVKDDPALAAAPPEPYAFSPDGARLLFGVGLGGGTARAAVVASSAGEVDAARLRTAASGDVDGAVLLGPASGGEFRSAREVFVWSSATMFGGSTQASLYDLSEKTRTELYHARDDARMSAIWRPGHAGYATLEYAACCGINLQRTAWLRGLDGTARQLGRPGVFGEMWWSADGARLYATVGGDDSVGWVRELLAGAGGMTYCKRGGTPPGPCT